MRSQYARGRGNKSVQQWWAPIANHGGYIIGDNTKQKASAVLIKLRGFLALFLGGVGGIRTHYLLTASLARSISNSHFTFKSVLLC
jgi:hypothetical protein